MTSLLPIFIALSAAPTQAQPYDAVVQRLQAKGLGEMGAYSLLSELTSKVGHRLSGSPQAEKAVAWGESTMRRLGFQNVRRVECMVPHWVRGRESLAMIVGDKETKLNACALGGSIATPSGGIVAEVVEVASLADAAKLGDRARGKIVLFNGPFDSTLVNSFGAYGRAVGQRSRGAVEAAKAGAVGVLVRSMTDDPDDEPHTGAMGYQEGVKQVPAAAVSVVAANKLHAALQRGAVRVRLELTCKTLPDVPSANVVGEIVGSERPDEVIVMGGHLDSWDKGQGAHDDGAGVTQSLEALRLIKELGLKPKRTIRVVLFMNEENGSRGARAYRDYAKTAKEKHIAAIESDSGGFAPRGFTCSLEPGEMGRLAKWAPALATFEAEKLTGGGGGGADVGPLAELGTVLFGLSPESQRYFDYHHSNKDTLDKVNRRELELGALAMATLAWLIAEEGIEGGRS